MLSQVIGREAIAVQQKSGESGAVLKGRLEIAVAVDADLDADAAEIATLLFAAVPGVVCNLAVRQMLIVAAVVHRIVPGGRA